MKALEKRFQDFFQIPVALSFASGQVTATAFNQVEKRVVQQITDETRRDEWLRSRQCLMNLLGSFGEMQNTLAVAFPNSRFSLSHSGSVSVAAGLPRGCSTQGVGVEFEGKRYVDPRSARFFLREEEMSDSPDLLRLWTVKEALFKADPHNANQGVRDYIVQDPRAESGLARHVEYKRFFTYRSEPVAGGWLTLALSLVGTNL